jgi:transcription initiation factor TFIIF subunit beta
MDEMFQCFREFQYWSVKALRQRLVQPEAYLRQVLDKIAVLNKSGPFANHYSLAVGFQDRAGDNSKEAAADEEDDEEDGADEMEDVIAS